METMLKSWVNMRDPMIILCNEQALGLVTTHVLGFRDKSGRYILLCVAYTQTKVFGVNDKTVSSTNQLPGEINPRSPVQLFDYLDSIATILPSKEEWVNLRLELVDKLARLKKAIAWNIDSEFNRISRESFGHFKVVSLTKYDNGGVRLGYSYMGNLMMPIHLNLIERCSVKLLDFESNSDMFKEFILRILPHVIFTEV